MEKHTWEFVPTESHPSSCLVQVDGYEGQPLGKAEQPTTPAPAHQARLRPPLIQYLVVA